MKEVGFKIFKTTLTLITGGVLGGSIIAVIGQKDKNKLKQETLRAQHINERCFKIIDTLQEELNKKSNASTQHDFLCASQTKPKSRELEQLRAQKMNERQDRAGFESQETVGENPC